MQTDRRKLYSVNSAAEALEISRSKLYELMARGLVRWVMVDSVRRIPDSEIQRIASDGVTARQQAA